MYNFLYNIKGDKSMENNVNSPEAPSLDIKMYSNNEIMSLNYQGQVYILTYNKYMKMLRESNRRKELEIELSKLKEKYELELNNLKEKYRLDVSLLQNRLAEEKDKATVQISHFREKLTESQKQEQKIKALLEQQGKGRPSKLTPEHKKRIAELHKHAETAVKRPTIMEYYKTLVIDNGYTGNYEGVRAYISNSFAAGGWLP